MTSLWDGLALQTREINKAFIYTEAQSGSGGGGDRWRRQWAGQGGQDRNEALSVGEDASEAGLVLLILLPDPCLQGPQFSAYHGRQGRI